MYMSQERRRDLKIAIERETEPLKKRIEALEQTVARQACHFPDCDLANCQCGGPHSRPLQGGER